MSFLSGVVQDNPQTKKAFVKMLQAPIEEPIVEMNEETARDINVIWNSINMADWRGKQNICVPGMPRDRKEFWGAFAGDHKAASLPVFEQFIKDTSGKGKIAIDLGSGNSPAVNSLLEKEWRVIAVDYSQSALDVLKAKNKAAVESGQLKIIKEDVSTYVPLEPVDLVVAADIFSYIDPAQFRDTWTKVHDVFIKESGFLIGTLFRSDCKPQQKVQQVRQIQQINFLKELGAWFLPDRRMVRPLLKQAGYEIKTCLYRIDIPEIEQREQMCIQFVAEKKTAS
ncbi:class I SAM-dependent methyltransferase [Candidatus Rhabdochlamydia sp. T3358]|uniref:class I SAM-dependent methyltransferase n=1 Tax=Candidatus Rhabdochlamydia sp. T3358 TaxID=2099795 RepID=UPI0010B7DE42|nr:class I SAM-dependent methyltransferase [Candidatus Rhabdochlamydia sp. T3358]VHO02137.1 Methyltransferase domain protein [Candidatus Rhabdochlamydia sp. T3358]